MKVVITGGASGIGQALACHYQSTGAAVFSLDVAAPPATTNGITFIECDITNQQALQTALRKIGPRIDLCISNAGIIRRGSLFATTPDEFDILFSVNVKGSWLFVREIMPFLTEGATILQMSSGHAMDPPDDPGVYALTKMCLSNFAEMLTKHYGKFVIKVAYPGPVDTPLAYYGLNDDEIAAKKSIMHSPGYVAEKIVSLLNSQSRELTFDDADWDYRLADATVRSTV